MTDGNLLSNLPEGLHEFCDPTFLEDLRNGHIPEFSWYSPRFIPQANKERSEQFRANTSNITKQQTFIAADKTSNAPGKRQYENIEEETKEERCARAEHGEQIAPSLNVDRFFPPLMHIVLSDNLDGKYNEEDGSVEQQVAQRRRALHLNWQHVTPIEQLWNGPPLNSKVPQARDFENILLDRENDYNDDEDDDHDHDDTGDKFSVGNTYDKNVA